MLIKQSRGECANGQNVEAMGAYIGLARSGKGEPMSDGYERRVLMIATDMVFRFFKKHPELCPHELRSAEEVTKEGDETVRTIRQKCIVCGYEKIHVVRTKNN